MTNKYANQEVNKIWQILKYAFVVVPIAAGLDKFLNLLVQWDSYLPSFVAGMLPFSTKVFMMIVGVIEIVAGLIVLNKTQLGAYIVSAWLLLIALLLFVSGHHLDVAVRDIVMSLSAWVLARLTGVVTTKAVA